MTDTLSHINNVIDALSSMGITIDKSESYTQQIYDKMGKDAKERGPKAKREKVRGRHAGELAGHERDARQADGRGRRSEERPD